MSEQEFLWHPSDQVLRDANWTRFIAAAGLKTYEELETRARKEPEWFWNAVIKHLDIRFTRPYERVLDVPQGIAHARWCIGGQTNFVLNAIDRHLPARKDHPAIVWEGESEGVREWTYGELNRQVNRLANGFAALGLKPGDVVAIYMPQVPEVVSAFLACAKLGCIAMPLFSGFGRDAVAARLRDADAAAIVTAVSTLRRGKAIPLKQVIDDALENAAGVRHVIVAGEPDADVPMRAGRDTWIAQFTDDTKRETLSLDAEHPVLLVFTSGTSGKPKGTVHTHCGYTVKAALDYQLCWDIKAGDRFQRFTDFGWFAGPMMVAGTLLSGATMFLTEGAPDYPAPDRLWRMIERQRISFLGLAPTLARSLSAQAGDSVNDFDLSSLRAVGSSGESWDAESWTWVFRNICKERIPLMNFCGGTEMGGLLSTNVLYPMKPGAFNGPIPGTGTNVVDANGGQVADGEIGELVMCSASIGTTRGLWREPERYIESYWSAIPGVWSQGDMAIFFSNNLVGSLTGLALFLLFWPLLSVLIARLRGR